MSPAANIAQLALPAPMSKTPAFWTSPGEWFHHEKWMFKCAKWGLTGKAGDLTGNSYDVIGLT
jgi:hypothetical protein